MATDSQRISARSNKGQPPQKYGTEDQPQNRSFIQRIGDMVTGGPGNDRSSNEDELSDETDISSKDKDGSVKRTVTLSGKPSSKKLMVEAQFEDIGETKTNELYELKLMNAELEAKIVGSERKLKNLSKELEKSRVDSLTSRECGLDSDKVTSPTKEIDKKLGNEINQIEEAIEGFRFQIIKNGILMEKLQKEIDKLPNQKRITQDLLEDDDPDQRLRRDDVCSNKQNSREETESWVKNHPLTSTEMVPTDNGEDAALLERLRRLNGDDVTNINQPPENINGRNYPVETANSTDKSDQMCEAMKMIAAVLQNQQAAQAIIPAPASSSNVTERFLIRQSHSKDLPMFSGAVEEWPAFYCDYQRTTEICGYSDDENLNRLRKCLKGEALKTVQCLLVSPNNLVKVMHTLKSRFGQTEHIIAAMIEKSRLAPSVREEKMETLIQYGTAVINLVSTIETLDCSSQLSNPSLLLELEKKLPNTMQRQWRLWIREDTQRIRDLRNFAEWMEVQTEIAYQICPPTIKDSNEKVQNKGQAWIPNKPRNNERVYAADSTDKPSVESVILCPCCDKNGHRLYKCDGFKAMPVDKRREFVEHKKLCYNCLSQFHMVKDCKSTYTCRVDNCGRRHHNILHIKEPAQLRETEQVNVSVESVNVFNGQGTNQDERVKGILGLVSVKLRGPNGIKQGYALVDSGSSTAIISEDASEELGLSGEETSLCIKGINSTIESTSSKTVSLWIKGSDRNESEYMRMRNIKTLKKLDLGKLSLDVRELAKRYPSLQGLPLKSYVNVKPIILIGAAHLHLTEPLKIVGGWQDQPRAYKSRLVWYVSGALPQRNRIDLQTVYHVCDSTDNDSALNELVKKSFTTEDFGVKLTHDKPRSKEDQRALQLLEKTTCRVELERFETGLLWRNESIELPESIVTARHRLLCQERKMDKNPEFAAAYVAKMAEYEDKGFIRKLTEKEVHSTDNRTWYLPHFGVLNPNKPGKLRLVFDAAAESNGTSLNKALVQGPDLNNSIVSVLIKFRQNEFAFAGDIKDMFHRILIRQEDRNSQRFLWRGLDRDRKPDVYEMQVMVFGSACSPCSAQYVKNLNANEHSSENLEACNAIVKKFYVDDYLDSKPTTRQACNIIKEVIAIQKKASFEVCNWVSNSKEVLNSLPENLRAKDLQSLEFGDSVMPTGRILGMWWDQQQDSLTFRCNFHKVSTDIFNGSKRPTKREVLKLVMSIYDPLGLVAHLVVKGKMIIQDLWRYGIGFDDEIPDLAYDKWKLFLEEINGLPGIKIPRCYSILIPEAKSVQLHLFCDASEKAFAAIAFLRITAAEGQIDVNIVMAKTRVSPLRPISIPRMELQAAVMAARVATSLKDEFEFKIDETHYWSDSRIVLCWLRNDARRFKQFVSHRVGEILEVSEVSQWHWVPTKDNVADDATRDMLPSDLSESSRWFNGSEFLRGSKSTWPKEKGQQALEEFSPETLELKVEPIIVAAGMEVSTDNLPYDINISRFSSFVKLIKTTAWIKRLFNNGRTKDKKKGELSTGELHEAHIYWIFRSQKERFAEEIKLLQEGKSIPGKSRLSRLSPIMKNGLLKLNSRFNHAPFLTENQRYPVILDSKDRFVQLLIEYGHKKYGHQGLETVSNALREQYWILNLKRAVKRASSTCVFCQIRRSMPSHPLMGNLPDARLDTYIQPFKNSGLDYFGPFNVKIGRRNEKRWGAVFTCLSTRAIHLEVAGSLSTDSAIMAIRRFANRRGNPEHIYCDNGTYFHGAANELKKALAALDNTTIERNMTSSGIQWHFNPPAAPHMGGVWERLVGSVKKVLNGLLFEKAVSDEVMQTLFTEVEWIINSRPLTNVPVDPKDPQPLTPNHFLLGWRSGTAFNGEGIFNGQPQGEFQDNDVWLRKQWRQAQRMADHFWTKWIKEYLPTLARRQKWFNVPRPIAVGDIVIVADDQAPRNSWMKGIIVAVYPGKDEIVRVADVKTKNGTYRRPVSKLCLLDVRDSTDNDSTEDDN